MDRTKSDAIYWTALAHHPKIGASTFGRLAARFTTMEKAWRASSWELRRAGLDERMVAAVTEARARFDPEKVTRQLVRRDIGVVTLPDQRYPKLLRQLPDPPGVLFLRGTLERDDDLSLAVVGSRKYSAYGARVVETIVPDLVKMGLTIVSGLALGIDGLAHVATLRCGGRTIAVLGSGLDQVYPPSNARVAEAIVTKGGALMSEFPPGTPSYPGNFPIRNRIIAGLTLGTLVVEAAADSGSLLTAKAALDYNREVFAVPGEIFRDQSVGTNNLIKMGAKVVGSADDILVELQVRRKSAHRKARKVIPDTAQEAILLEILSDYPLPIDRLVKESRLPIQTVGSTLILMEMKGKVKNVGGTQYVKQS